MFLRCLLSLPEVYPGKFLLLEKHLEWRIAIESHHYNSTIKKATTAAEIAVYRFMYSFVIGIN